MLRRIIICIAISITLAFGLIFCCSVLREKKVTMNTAKINELIKIGDNIFEAKKKLERANFIIKYGPGFSVYDKSYYSMIVDYGIRPNVWDIFKYTVGIEGDGKPISGKIRADPSGNITSIR